MTESPRSVALFVSPHLDDVAFSCAGTLAHLHRRGWRVAMATVFTRSVPRPTGFALACQLDKGLGPDVDYLALRRLEDAEAARRLGADPVDWLDLPEAPHRGYDSAASLFAGVRADDRIAPEVARRLERLVDRLRPAWIFAPQAIGNHADHRQVVRAVLDRSPWSGPVAWYRDLPYAAKFPAAGPSPDLPAELAEVACPLAPADLAAKVAASAAYRSQVPFQFGAAADAVSRSLGDFARLEGARLGVPGPAEAFRVAPAAVELWADLVGTSG